MSTRGTITAKMSSGRYKCVFLRFDAYPGNYTGAGITLRDAYSTQEAVEKLLAEGDIYSLGGRCDKPMGEHIVGGERQKGYTTYFNRDGTDTSAVGHVGNTVEEAQSRYKDHGVEYAYVWNGEYWTCNTYPLSLMIAGSDPYEMADALLAELAKYTDIHKIVFESNYKAV